MTIPQCVDMWKCCTETHEVLQLTSFDNYCKTFVWIQLFFFTYLKFYLYDMNSHINGLSRVFLSVICWCTTMSVTYLNYRSFIIIFDICQDYFPIIIFLILHFLGCFHAFKF